LVNKVGYFAMEGIKRKELDKDIEIDKMIYSDRISWD
jgi:hypothetical protein